MARARETWGELRRVREFWIVGNRNRNEALL